MSDTPASARPSSRLLDYLRLFRLPNVFTALADIIMGVLFVQGQQGISTLGEIALLLCLAAASGLIYTAGMVLNDVFDIEVDAVERPQRPLPSGRIGLGWARFLGYELLVVGAILAGVAGLLAVDPQSLAWRPAVVGLALAGCVLLYDGVLKKFWIAPLAMGGCRFWNVLLGMSIGGVGSGAHAWLLYYDLSELLVAAGIGTYIVGVTQFARNEAKENQGSFGLIIGAVIMACGLAMLTAFPLVGDGAQRAVSFNGGWEILMLLLSGLLLRRALWVIWKPSPGRIMGAIKVFIFSLVLLDAAVCLAVGQMPWAIGVCCLLLPMFLLGRWVYST